MVIDARHEHLGNGVHALCVTLFNASEWYTEIRAHPEIKLSKSDVENFYNQHKQNFILNIEEKIW